jgi:hypothetical protein
MLEISSKQMLIIEMPQWDLAKYLKKCKKKNVEHYPRVPGF